MNKILSIRLPRHYLLVRGITCWFIHCCLLSGLMLPCQAQSNRKDQIDHIQKNSWHNPYEPQSMYASHVEALQHQFKCLLKPLTHLSAVDPATYSILQGNLHAYLRQLEQERADYGKMTIYQDVQLQFILFEEQIKAALAQSRRLVHEQGFIPDKTQTLTKGLLVSVRPYALVFKKPHYRSTVRHIILPRETVTVLKDEGTFCQVKCAFYKGYLSKGMIVSYTP